MEPRNIIKSTITTVQAISSIYEEIQDLRDVPNEFSEVNQYLPLAKNTLRLARDHLQGLALDRSSEKTIQTLVSGLNEKAKMLQDVFKQVETGVQNTKDESMLDFYRTLLLRLGKAHRVESLMQDLLRGLNALATNQLFETETRIQTAELKNAINQLSEVESCVPDSAFQSSGTNFTQNIASNGTGYQSHYSGQGQQINTGSGTMNNYSATTMSFVPSNKDDKARRDTIKSLNASPYLDRKNRNLDRVSGTREWLVGRNYFQHQRDQAEAEKLRDANQDIALRDDRPRRREDFQIAIICALPLEYDAVSLLFDQFWDEDESYGRAPGDTNSYTTGRIGKCDVVLVLLPNMGTAAAAGAAASFRSSYSGLQLAFVVGVCGGVPGKGASEVLLGDVVISKAVQYSLGKQYPNTFVTKDTVDDSLGRPNKNIRSLIASFETELGRERLQQKTRLYLKDLQSAAARKRRRYSYQYPGAAEDKLFAATYRHRHRGPQPCSSCDGETGGFCEEAARASCAELNCDEGQLVRRKRLEMKLSLEPNDEQCPEILIGRMASGDVVMKSGEHRDQIAKQQNVIAFEMEGAGIWDEIPCIIVKGICDYADSHKNKLWQPFAAATAASVMKAMLGRYTLSDL